ncbi:MAG: hypothetical protein KGL13_09190 [Gammaproteobacteria bacterium]|nr:hypothetical protein [Gammaproteobacteria bacterium]MDE2346629.1 hypothetical protein [Gammaproteobacteria bacterium]
MMKSSVLMAGIGCLLLAGCAVTTSEMLVNPGLANGPTRGKDMGVIRYLAQGSAADIQARQLDANLKMSNACHGKYRVVSTGVNNKINFSGAGRFRTNATSTDYVYIRFVCTGR